jgi:hypothetical protein
MKTVVLIFVNAFQLYLVLGLIVAIFIQRKGLKKIDPSVEGAGVWFRVLTFPGIVAFWPVMLFKWVGKSKNDS